VVEISGGITIGAEALTLNGAGISDGGALRNISGNNTWQGAISNNNGARINSDAGKLTVSGNITSGTQNFYVGGAGDIDITGTISGSASAGNGAIYKDGAGRLTLTGNNTGLTGLVRVLGGTASIATANNIGSGTVEIGGSGTLATTADLTRTAG
jgi:autotransporter-associated beta strand protein